MKKAYEKTYEKGVQEMRMTRAFEQGIFQIRVPLRVPWGTLGVPWVAKAIFSDLSKIGRPIPSKCVYLHVHAHRI